MKKNNHIHGLAVCLLLAYGGITSMATVPATITAVNLGSGTPPATLGGYTMTPITGDASSVGSIASSVGIVSFDQPLLHDQIGNGWETWSHGYTGNVYDTTESANPLFLTLTLASPVSAFDFYVESLNFTTFSFTATAQDGSTISQDIVGESGASGFGFYSTDPAKLISSITVSGTDADGFAVAEFASSYVPTATPDASQSFALLGLGFLATVAFKRVTAKTT